MAFSLSRFAFRGWKYVLAVIVVGAVGFWWFSGQTSVSGSTLAVTRGDFTMQVNVSGTVVAARDVDLGFASNGRIQGVYATVGQRVLAGAVLAETENGDLAAAIAQKQAALAQAEAKLAALASGTRPEEVAIAEGSVDNAKAALVTEIESAYAYADDAVRNRTDQFFTNPRTVPQLMFSVANSQLELQVEQDRTKAEQALKDWSGLLVGLGSANAPERARAAQGYLAQVTALLVDANAALNQAVPDPTTTAADISSYSTSLATARSNVNAAATGISSDLSALDAAEKNLALKRAGTTSEDIAAQEAAVASAAADVRSAQAAYAKTRVVAPFTGIVTRMDAKVGEIASPSVSSISLQSDGQFQVETFVPEMSVAAVAVGNAATTTLDAYGAAASFPAKIVAIDPAETVKDGVPTYKVLLAFLSSDARIRSGMTADVRITTGVLKDAVVIPSGAVGSGPSGKYVSVVVEDAVETRPVTTGVTAALGQIEITSGLDGGEVILVTPARN